MAKKGRTGKKKPAVDYNKPGFSARSMDRSIAKKKVMNQLRQQGITGADASRAMSRGKLTQDASGSYTFKTDAMSPSGRDIPLPKTP
jgi:hypothetical protein